jgi:hypothetical protein
MGNCCSCDALGLGFLQSEPEPTPTPAFHSQKKKADRVTGRPDASAVFTTVFTCEQRARARGQIARHISRRI